MSLNANVRILAVHKVPMADVTPIQSLHLGEG